MADVFISYKRERRPAARHLEQILVRYGYSVWFDLALVRGADYEEQIQRELNAAKAVIVLWCGLSVKSPGVRSEASRAKAQDKLIPLVIEPCELPLFSTLEQNIDLSGATGSPRDHALDPVLDDLERLVGRAPIADLKGLREYDATWRTMTGGLPLARLPTEQVAVIETEVAVAAAPALPPPTAHDYGFWSAEWEKHRAGENVIALRLIAEDAPRYFAEQAKVRIAEIEEEQRRQANKAEKSRAAEVRVRGYREEGRIKVDAKIIYGAPEGWFLPGAGKVEWFKDLDIGPEMVVVPKGEFTMGSNDHDEEKPPHRVVIAAPFAVGVTPVTRAQFAAYVTTTKRDIVGLAYGWTGMEWKRDNAYSWRDPGFPQQDDHPVVFVSWLHANNYASWLGQQTGKRYRLLSEAEWEYCCRAATTTAYSVGASITREQGNFSQTENGTTPVRKYQANHWGLHDMHGNVCEWCQDSWHPSYLGAPSDGTMWPDGENSFKVLRGGSWSGGTDDVRSSNRSKGTSAFSLGYSGFRLARTLSDGRRAVTKAVLTTKVVPTYDDLPEERYHFPRAYLNQLQQAVGDFIIYYEPRLWRVNLGETGGGDRNGMRRPVAASSSCRFVPAASGFAIPRDA